MAPTKKYPDSFTGRFQAGTLAAISAVLAPGEPMAAFARMAVKMELERRREIAESDKRSGEKA